jgi:hypothetical protein
MVSVTRISGVVCEYCASDVVRYSSYGWAVKADADGQALDDEIDTD